MTKKENSKKQIIKDHFASKSLLKRVDTLGYFDFSTYLITLESINQQDLVNIETFLKAEINDEEFVQLKKLIPLAAHEYTHFIDATSTIWGINYLFRMSEAYISEQSRNEQQFYKAKYFYDFAKGISLSDYYTQIGPGEESDQWLFDPSIGRQFDKDGKVSDSSIFFLRFKNPNGELLARSPLSTISVLEASAMAQEIRVNIELILKSDVQTRDIKQGSFQAKTLSYIYNKSITEYSSCVHLVSTHFQITDVSKAFDICSVLTGIVLNFPTKAFKQVSDFCDFKSVLKFTTNEDWINAIKDGIKNQNLGILFYLLIHATNKEKLINFSSYKEAFKVAIQRITSWTFEVFQQEIKDEFLAITENLKESPIDSIKIFSAAGYANFQKISTLRSGFNFTDLDLPPFFDQELNQRSVFNIKTNELRNLNLENVFNEMQKGDIWVRKFYSACI